MQTFDLVLDIVLFLTGIISLTFIIVRRKLFDMWLALPTCVAWLLKGLRVLYYDWVVNSLRNTVEFDKMRILLRDASVTANVMDALITYVLVAALVRIGIRWLHNRWYKKAIAMIRNEKGRG